MNVTVASQLNRLYWREVPSSLVIMSYEALCRDVFLASYSTQIANCSSMVLRLFKESRRVEECRS